MASGSAGLQIVDIRNPANPRITALVDTSGDAREVYVFGDYACVADGSCGLQIIDSREPHSLRIIAAYDIPGETRSVRGLASTVYTAGFSCGFGVFDVIDRSRQLKWTFSCPTRLITGLSRMDFARILNNC